MLSKLSAHGFHQSHFSSNKCPRLFSGYSVKSIKALNPATLLSYTALSASLCYAQPLLAADALPELPKAAISENSLVEMSRTESIVLNSLKAQGSRAQIANSAYQEKFSGMLSSSLSYENSDEPSLSSSPSPDSTTSQTINVGYGRAFRHGLSLSAGAFYSNSDFSGFVLDDYQVTGLKLGVEVDLWKNALGRLDKLKEGAFAADAFKSTQVQQIKSREHTQAIRSLFWSLVANKEIQLLREKIISSVTKQEKEIKAQQNLYVSDQSDVTRFSALKELQKSGLIMLKYQREQLESSLKNVFPSLRGKSLTLENVNLDQASRKVVQCIDTISKSPDLPLESTSWLKVIEATNVAADANKRSNNNYQTPELKLSSNVTLSDHSPTSASAQAAIEGDQYQKSNIMLSLNVPLGSAKSDTEKWQNYAIEFSRQAENESYKASIATTHEKTIKLIMLLNEALKTQSTVNELNQKNLEFVRKKYNRAELPLVQLIEDETNFLTGKVAELETKLLVINTVLEYFKVFDMYRCDFNVNA